CAPPYSPQAGRLNHDGLVTTPFTRMDHGYAIGISDSTAWLSHALAAYVIFCRHHGTWYFTWCGHCRRLKFTPVDGRHLYCFIIGGNFMGTARPALAQ